MDPKKIGDIAGRLKSGGKGFGTGIGFLAAAGALAYGVSQSVYTGNDDYDNTCRRQRSTGTRVIFDAERNQRWRLD